MTRQRSVIERLANGQAEVRRLAAEACLPNMARPDSQGICFLGKVGPARLSPAG